MFNVARLLSVFSKYFNELPSSTALVWPTNFPNNFKKTRAIIENFSLRGSLCIRDFSLCSLDPWHTANNAVGTFVHLEEDGTTSPPQPTWNNSSLYVNLVQNFSRHHENENVPCNAPHNGALCSLSSKQHRLLRIFRQLTRVLAHETHGAPRKASQIGCCKVWAGTSERPIAPAYCFVSKVERKSASTRSRVICHHMRLNQEVRRRIATYRTCKPTG